jgi:predicted metalloprotease with PDZ domain
MLLDLKIRNETNNAKSLDDVMRRLYNEFYLEKKRGFTDNEFRLVCEEIAGCNLNEIFEIYAPATTVIDYPKYLAYGGLGIDTSSKILEGVHLGADIRNIDNRLMVRFVELNSPAYQAGLSVDDEVTAVNGHPINKSALDKILSNSHPGDVLRFTVKHQDIQSEYKVKLGIRTIKTFEISKLTKTNELQEVIYKSWFVE